MSLKIYKVSDYETTHEREQFENLSNLLKTKYDSHEDLHLLIANPSFENKDIDAVFIKRDAITVIELKNYGGNLSIAENGDWKCNGTTVKGGSNGKNPYMQVKLNKTGLCGVFNTWFYKPNVNLSHVSGIVLFNQPITIENDTISQNVKTWFHVTDMDGIVSKLHNITSQSINYTSSDLEELVVRLNFSECLEYQSQIVEPATEENAEIFEGEELEITEVPVIAPDGIQQIIERIEEIGFATVAHFPIPKREGRTINIAPLNLSEHTTVFLNNKVQGNIWEHQYSAIELAKQNQNVCLTTSTSSGKSYVFYSAGIERISNNPQARIIAVYPLKALGVQQEENWINALIAANLPNVEVGRIDGDVGGEQRRNILRECNVIIITPDTIHTFLLGKLSDHNYTNDIKQFLAKTEMVVIDEVHTYKGIFGSNAAYLYRRLNHAIDVLSGNVPKYIAASATISDPENHLFKITGLNFEIVNNDSSPNNASDILLIQPQDGDGFSSINELVQYFAQDTTYKGITFLDSRKMVEQIAAGDKRKLRDDEEDEILNPFNNIDRVVPFRSGYNKDDASEIQSILMNGLAKCIVTTSALEMGIDIKELDLCILYGIPYSSTSLYQRIGRVGRVGCQNDGLVIIVNDGSIRSNTIFQEPRLLFNIPNAEGALYLENETLQNIHALCFAEQNGEYDNVVNDIENFSTNIQFPDQFISLCNSVRSRITTTTYDDIREKGGVYPQLNFPIRDLEPQFKVIQTNGNQEYQKGNLSRSQVQREAYPGAMYYYMGTGYRVTRIQENDRIVYVRRERQYYTKPLQIPATVFPQLTGDKIYNALRYSNLKIIESELLIYERINGFLERRGGADPLRINYPLTGNVPDRVYYNKTDFSRTYKTTGVVISHPILLNQGVNVEVITQLIYEVFLLHIPFEQQDISCAKGRFRPNELGFETNASFIAIYDQSYGSLRLTRRLIDFEDMKKVIDKAYELISTPEAVFSFIEPDDLNPATIEALEILRDELNQPQEELNFAGLNNICVIRPGSHGLHQGNVLTVINVVSTPIGLKYILRTTVNNAAATRQVRIEEVEPSEDSQMGIFNFETYEVE